MRSVERGATSSRVNSQSPKPMKQQPTKSRFDAATLVRLAEAGLDPARMPEHVAVIMDGNGRWAKQRGLPRVEGHARGVQSVRATVEEGCRRRGRPPTLHRLRSQNCK